MHRVVWTDLQYLLAVAEKGSLAGAARALRVDHSTVLRRMKAFERGLGVRVFERLPTGYVLTDAGQQLARAATTMQDTLNAVERQVAGRDLEVTGTVRVTTTDTLALTLVPRALAELAKLHPRLEVELTTTTQFLSLTKRDADIAVRPTATPPENLVGRRIASVAIALYASPAYLERVPARRALQKHVWLAPDDSLASTTIGRWMKRELRGVAPVFRADTLTTLAHAAAAGHGVAPLPCYLGDRIPTLRRIRGAVPEMTTQLWLLTHADLSATPRIRAVMEALAGELDRHRALIEGRGVAPTDDET